MTEQDATTTAAEAGAMRGPIVLTLMVRDEVDIVAAMIEHHLDQGVDRIIATDNASVDGTREVLAEYEALGVLTLLDDSRHEKQQAEVVTAMARRAVEEHGASWVINADADEFWAPVDRSRTLAEVLRELPDRIESLRIPVVNLLGAPAEDGPVLSSLAWRDVRAEDELKAVGLHAQPTADMLVRGVPGLEIAQGNHFSNLPVTEAAPEGLGIEVLHVPFRSWTRYERRVRNTGEAYDRSPHLTPSPRHHGMRDWRWLQGGVLRPFYAARFPTEGESAPAGFEHDTWLAERLAELVGRARRPELLEPLLAPVARLEDEAALRERFAIIGPLVTEAERERVQAADWKGAHDLAVSQRDELSVDGIRAGERIAQLEAQLAERAATIQGLEQRLSTTQTNLDQLQAYVAEVLADRSVRLGLAVSGAASKAIHAVRPPKQETETTLERLQGTKLRPSRFEVRDDDQEA